MIRPFASIFLLFLAACTSRAVQPTPGPIGPPSVVAIVLDDIGRDEVYPGINVPLSIAGPGITQPSSPIGW